MKVVLSQNNLKVAIANQNNTTRVTFGAVPRIGTLNLTQFNHRASIANKNNVGRVTFGGVSKIETVNLTQLGDVSTAGQIDGDVLVYQSATDSYAVTTLPKIDGGRF